MPVWGRRALLVWLALQAVAGCAWALQAIGELPHYGDTAEYLRLARELQVDAHRGVFYPAFLAGVDALFPSADLLRPIQAAHGPRDCPVTIGVALVQWIQLFACGAALYGLFAAIGRRLAVAVPSEGVERRAWPAAITALVLFDPLIAHYALSLMPDALALAATALFLTGLVGLSFEPRVRVRDGLALFAGFAFAAGLRPEKGPVLLAVVVTSGLVFLGLARSARRDPVPKTIVRPVGAAVALGIALVAFAGGRALHRSVETDLGRPDQTTIIAHARLVFPHLQEIAPTLSPETRALFGPDDIGEYDAHPLNPGHVMKRVTGGDRERAEAVTRELAAAALRERGGAIVFDTLKDALENAWPTPGWYVRLAAMGWIGLADYQPRFTRSDGSPWSFLLMRRHHPRETIAMLGLSGATFVACLGVAVPRLRRRLRERSADARRRCVGLVAPGVLFALGNGAIFAIHADQINPRYTLGAAALGLAVVYAAVLDAIAAQGPGGADEAPESPPPPA